MTNEWDELIHKVIAVIWPIHDFGWVKSQIKAESNGVSDAVSPSGAEGLLQLMPGTFKEELDYLRAKRPELQLMNSVFHPFTNVACGVDYLRRQYNALLTEVPPTLGETNGVIDLALTTIDVNRLYWAFASYNAGRGYIEKALGLASKDNRHTGHLWEVGKYYLFHRKATANGRYCDYNQVWTYVDRIIKEKNRHEQSTQS